MFKGFSQRTVEFMWNLSFYNERDWFLAHKQEFEEVLRQPMTELAAQVGAAYGAVAPELALETRVCRIQRDARRLHGRGPYKDHLWFSLYRPMDTVELPVFWFELRPQGCDWGLGYYQARPATMLAHRQAIDRDPDPLLRLQAALRQQSSFALEGESYARPKGDPGPLLKDWYNMKSFSLIHSQGYGDEIFSPQLADTLVADFEFLTPFYRYFSSLPGLFN